MTFYLICLWIEISYSCLLKGRYTIFVFSFIMNLFNQFKLLIDYLKCVERGSLVVN